MKTPALPRSWWCAVTTLALNVPGFTGVAARVGLSYRKDGETFGAICAISPTAAR